MDSEGGKKEARDQVGEKILEASTMQQKGFKKKGAKEITHTHTHTTLTFELKLNTLEVLKSPIRPFLISIPDAPTIQRYASGHAPGAFQSAHSDRRGTAVFVGYEAHVRLLFLVSPVL